MGVVTEEMNCLDKHPAARFRGIHLQTQCATWRTLRPGRAPPPPTATAAVPNDKGFFKDCVFFSFFAALRVEESPSKQLPTLQQLWRGFYVLAIILSNVPKESYMLGKCNDTEANFWEWAFH